MQETSTAFWTILRKKGGNKKDERAIREFRKMLLDTRLLDCGFQGSQFTWANNRDEELIMERLDKVLVSE